MTLDQAKAALIFEALRRRPEVQRAARLPEGWQIVTGLAWAWKSESWADLHADQQARLLCEVRKPTFTPPTGYSCFPEDDRAASEAASLVALKLPADDDCDAAVDFVRRARALERAGLTLAAVNTTTRQAIRYAADALARRPVTSRLDDLGAPRMVFGFVGITHQLEDFDERGKPSDFMSRIRL